MTAASAARVGKKRPHRNRDSTPERAQHRPGPPFTLFDFRGDVLVWGTQRPRQTRRKRGRSRATEGTGCLDHDRRASDVSPGPGSGAVSRETASGSFPRDAETRVALTPRGPDPEGPPSSVDQRGPLPSVPRAVRGFSTCRPDVPRRLHPHPLAPLPRCAGELAFLPLQMGAPHCQHAPRCGASQRRPSSPLGGRGSGSP